MFGLGRGPQGPHNPPELWQTISKKRQKQAIADYQEELAAAMLASAAATNASGSEVAPALAASATKRCDDANDPDYIPRLPREGENHAQDTHREKNLWHPPCCIARKLSKREMESCPRAKKALDAEWEKLRFLKRPHPTKGLGAWDEGNVREASSVRREAQAAGKTVHLGRIVELCHEKGSELSMDDPDRK